MLSLPVSPPTRISCPPHPCPLRSGSAHVVGASCGVQLMCQCPLPLWLRLASLHTPVGPVSLTPAGWALLSAEKLLKVTSPQRENTNHTDQDDLDGQCRVAVQPGSLAFSREARWPPGGSWQAFPALYLLKIFDVLPSRNQLMYFFL